MSYNLNPLKTVMVKDPVTMLNNERIYAILVGGSQNSYKPFTTTSISSSSIQFSTPPPSPSIIVNRKMYVQIPIRMTFIASVPNANNLIRANYDAPRAWPISSALNTLTVNINNTAVSNNMSDIIHPLLHYNTNQILKDHDYSSTPSCVDQSQNYGDLQGMIRSPLAGYGDSSDEDVMSRGGFPFRIVTNTPGLAVIDMLITEPIWLSPFYWGCGNAGGFIGVQSMDWNFTFLSNSAFRMWSHDASGALAPGVITGGSVMFSGFPTAFSFPVTVPRLLFNYITPKELQTIPRSVTYPYADINRYPSDFPLILAGASMRLPSQNIQLQSIPRRIYIAVRNNNAMMNSSPTFTDTYMAINKISINWNNFNGLLSSATKEDLYRISVKNHCNMSWTQWSGGPVYAPGSLTTLIGTIGSVLCLEMGTDIGLSDTECPGMLGTYQLQLDVDVTNVNQTNSITPTLYIIVVSEGTFTIENNRSISQIGVVSKMDVLDAKQNLSNYVNYEDIQDVNGGDFISGLKSFGQKLWNGAKKAWPYIQKGLEIVKTIAPLLGGEDEDGGVLYDNSNQGEYIGGTHVGGRMMSRKSLKNRLRG